MKRFLPKQREKAPLAQGTGYPFRPAENLDMLRELWVNQVNSTMKSRQSVSPSLYQHLFNRDPDPHIIYRTEDGRVIDANQSALDLYGYSDTEIVELSISNLRKNTEDTPQQHAWDLPVEYSDGSNWHWHIKKSGEPMLVEENIGAEGDFSLLRLTAATDNLSVGLDLITLPFHRHEKYRFVATSCSDALYEWSLQDNQIEWEILPHISLFDNQYPKNFQQFLRAVHPEDRAPLCEVVDAGISTRRTVRTWESRLRIKDQQGAYQYVIHKAKVLNNDAGDPAKVVGSLRIVTEKVKHLAELEAMNKVLKEIAWDQSHLVRAPLARIKSLSTLIQGGHMGELSLKELLSYMDDSVDELDNIIKDVVRKSNLTN